MKRKLIFSFAALSFLLFGVFNSVFASPVDTFLPGVSLSSGWSDAEKKDPANDSNLCWAAAASNVLNYTGWGAAGGFSNEDAIFSDFTSHWTNLGGDSTMAYAWWFTGVNYAYGDPSLSQPDQSFNPYTNTGWPGYIGMDNNDFKSGDYLREANASYLGGTYNLLDLDDFLRAQIDDGYGTNIGVATGPSSSHAMTAWGYGYDEDKVSSVFTGYYLYLTDSDDNEYGGPNDIDLYWLAEVDSSSYGRRLNLYEDETDNYIGFLNGVRSLAPVPVPSTIVLLGGGLLGLVYLGRKRFLRK